MDQRESVIIIGGGVSGCLAALFAARVVDANGKPRYKVTLLEGNKHILSGSSMVGARLHLGGEYPNDMHTATDCLWGAMLWKLMMPAEGVFSDMPPMRFYVAQESDKQATGKHGQTLKKYREHFVQMRDQYEGMVNNFNAMVVNKKIAGHDHKKDPHFNEWLSFEPGRFDDQLYARLFGKPEDYIHEIAPQQLAMFQGHMKGGFVTQEPGFDMMSYLSGLEAALKTVKAGNTPNPVNVITSARVTKIIDKGGGRAGYRLVDDNGRNYDAQQIIQAAWEGGFALDSEHRDADHAKQAWVYRRAIAVVDISKIPPEQLPHIVKGHDEQGKPILQPHGCFVLKGKHGGMFSPLNKNLAMCYAPSEAHLGEVFLNSDDPNARNIPPSWRNPLSASEKEALKQRYKKALVGDPEHGMSAPFPFLKDAEIADIIVRPTLNFDIENNYDRRRHEPTEEIKPGFHTMYSTKLTLAPASAIIAVQNLRERSDNPAVGQNYKKLENQTGKNYALKTVLNDPVYRVNDMIPTRDSEKLYRFINERGLGVGFNSRLDFPTPYHGPFHPGETQTPLLASMPSAGDVAGRSFGQGFGPSKLVIYTQSGPKTGRVFGESEEENAAVCAALGQWCAQDDPTLFTMVLSPENAEKALQNRLRHAPRLEIAELVKSLESPECATTRAALFGKQNLKLFPNESWEALRQSRPGDLPIAKVRLPDLTDATQWNSKRLDLLATMLPTLYQTLPDDVRAKVRDDIASALNKAGRDRQFFAPLADPDVNRLVIRNENAPLHAQKIYNNGRAIQVDYQPPTDPKPADFSIQFQGKTYYPVQFHFHRNRNLQREADGTVKRDANGVALTEASVRNRRGEADGGFEFNLYPTPAKRQQIEGTPNDPNMQAVGELHTIFMTPRDAKTGQRQALALCAHVRLGQEANPGFEPVLSALRGANHALEPGEEVHPSQPVAYQPLRNYNHGEFSTRDGLPQTAFSSLNLGWLTTGDDGKLQLAEGASDIFHGGVQVVHLPPEQSVTISAGQLEALENAQPKLAPLMRNLAVFPVSLAPGSAPA